MVPLREKNLAVSRSLKRRMERFLRDREAALLRPQPPRSMRIILGERQAMLNYIGIWILLSGQGDEEHYKQQDEFLRESLCLAYLSRPNWIVPTQSGGT
jgi:hypothetical protein